MDRIFIAKARTCARRRSLAVFFIFKMTERPMKVKGA